MKRSLIFLTLALAGVASAQQGVSWSSYTSAAADGDITIGYKFDVTQAFSVSALGWFTDPNKGNNTLSQDHEVGLWDGSGNMLASADVTDSDSLIGMFKWASIKPVNLAVGTNYVVGGFSLAGGDQWAYGDTFNGLGANFNGYSTSPDITNAVGWFQYGPSFIEPNGTYHAMYGGGNIMATPEPATYAVFGLGLLGLVVRRKRR